MSSSQVQVHQKGSVRHSEKRRIGTCKFADRIARFSLDAYRNHVPESFRQNQKQTVVAAIVAFFHPESSPTSSSHSELLTSEDKSTNQIVDSGRDSLQIMGLGVGTKFLSQNALSDMMNISDYYGKELRDCHAEVLARRAFCRQLATEILFDLKKSNGDSDTMPQPPNYKPILRRKLSYGEKGHPQYELLPDVTLHFYTSSAPCGNATLKKFSKMFKEKYNYTLDENTWPNQIHGPLNAHSIQLGQLSLLLKKSQFYPQNNNDSKKIKTSLEQQVVQNDKTEISHSNGKNSRKKKVYPADENDTWCPPGTTIVPFAPDKGSIHSCSDKICRWNCLGWQGSFLASFISSSSKNASTNALSSVVEDDDTSPTFPIYMNTMTIGRKMSACICKRALCCRATGFNFNKNSINNVCAEVENSLDENDKTGTLSSMSFRVNHPVVMGTEVYLDDSGVLEMTGIKTIGQDVRMHSSLCWVWWPSKTSTSNQNNVDVYRKDNQSTNVLSQPSIIAECIDGSIGYAVDYESQSCSGRISGERQTLSSDVSTFSLLKLYAEILSLSIQSPGVSIPAINQDDLIKIIDRSDNEVLTNKNFPKTLKELLLWKKATSVNYEEAKDILLSKHRVLGKWNRRSLLYEK